MRIERSDNTEYLTPLRPLLATSVAPTDNLLLKNTSNPGYITPTHLRSNFADNDDIADSIDGLSITVDPKRKQFFGSMTPQQYIAARFGNQSPQMYNFTSWGSPEKIFPDGVVTGQYIDNNGEVHIIVNYRNKFGSDGDKNARRVKDINLAQRGFAVAGAETSTAHPTRVGSFSFDPNEANKDMHGDGRWYSDWIHVNTKGKRVTSLDDFAKEKINTDAIQKIVDNRTSNGHGVGFDTSSDYSNYLNDNKILEGIYRVHPNGKIYVVGTDENGNQTETDSLWGYTGDYNDWTFAQKQRMANEANEKTKKYKNNKLIKASGEAQSQVDTKAYGGRLYSNGGRIQTRPAPNSIRAQNGLKLRKADGMGNDEYDVYL